MPSIDGIDDDNPPKGYGVYGETQTGAFAIYGVNDKRDAVVGKSLHGKGMHGSSSDRDGVFGNSSSGSGVYGLSSTGDGVRGISDTSAGVYAECIEKGGVGVHVKAPNGNAGVISFCHDTAGIWFGGLYAGLFYRRVDISGTPMWYGSKNFKIDHSPDPVNKYLYHSSVKSSEMKSI